MRNQPLLRLVSLATRHCIPNQPSDLLSILGIPRPIVPLQSHNTEHGRNWSPFDTAVVKGRRTYTGRIRPTTRLDVLLSCSDGDMPDFRRHVGSGALFRELGSAKKQAQAQQLAAQQQKQAAARERAEMARAEEMAANRQHGYSTRVRNTTKSFKVGLNYSQLTF